MQGLGNVDTINNTFQATSQVHDTRQIHIKSLKTKQSYRIASNQFKSNQIKSNQIKSNQIKSNQIKSNQIKSNQIKSNQISDHTDPIPPYPYSRTDRDTKHESGHRNRDEQRCYPLRIFPEAHISYKYV
jgi:hypothetical protein